MNRSIHMSLLNVFLYLFIFLVKNGNTDKFPDDWKQWRENCYYFNATELRYFEIDEKCKTFGAEMVTILSADENEFIVNNMLKYNGSEAYIQLKRSNDTFKWNNGQIPIYTNWNRDEKIMLGHMYRRCIVILQSGRWENNLCVRPSFQVCKISNCTGIISQNPFSIPTTYLPVDLKVTSKVWIHSCPKDWKWWNGKCYYFNETMISYSDNEKKCKSFGGELLSISSVEETEFIKDNIKNFHHGPWIQLFCDGGGEMRCKWADGRVAVYTNWGSGESFNYDRNSCFRVYKSGKWFAESCLINVTHACQIRGEYDRLVSNVTVLQADFKDLEEFVSTKYEDIANGQRVQEVEIRKLLASVVQIKEALEQQINSVLSIVKNNALEALDYLILPNDIKIYEAEQELPVEVKNHIYDNVELNKRYRFVKDLKSFNESEMHCYLIGESLVTIRNEYENNFIKNHSLFGSTYWIASMRIFSNSNYFGNIYDGKFPYSNWALNEPKVNITANCLNVKHGQWFVNECDERFSFICESNLNETKRVNISMNTLLERQILKLKQLTDISMMNELKGEYQDNWNDRIKEFIKNLSRIKRIDLNDALNVINSKVDFDSIMRRNRSKREKSIDMFEKKFDHDNVNYLSIIKKLECNKIVTEELMFQIHILKIGLLLSLCFTIILAALVFIKIISK